MAVSRMVFVQLLLVLLSVISPSFSINHDYEPFLFKDDSFDAAQGKKNRLWRYAAIAHWDDINQINTDEKLAGLARQGCYEISQAKSRKEIPSGFVPTIMGAIRVGNNVYFSSSSKGLNFFYGSIDDTPSHVIKDDVCSMVRLTLQRCTNAQGGDTRHGMGAQCAEMFALQAYCIHNEQRGGALPALEDTRSIAVACDYDNPDNSKIVQPCTGTSKQDIPRAFGCMLVLQDLGIPWAGNGESGQGFTDPTVKPDSKVPACVLPKDPNSAGGDKGESGGDGGEGEGSQRKK